MACFLMVGCEEEQKASIPANVIPQARMEKILMEIHDAEARILQTGVRQDTAKAVFLHFQQQIFKKYKVDTGSVNRSLRFYTHHIELLDSMYRKMEAKAIKVK